MERFAPLYDAFAFTLVEMLAAFAGLLAIAVSPRRAGVAARLDGLGRAARDRRLRERARVPRADVGAAPHDGDAHRARVLAGAGLGGVLRLHARGRPARWPAWLGCAVIMAGIVVAEPAAATRCVGSCGGRDPHDRRPARARLRGALRRDDGCGPRSASAAAATRAAPRSRPCSRRSPSRSPRRRSGTTCIGRLAVPARRPARAGRLADPLHAGGARDRRVAHVGHGRRRAARRRRDRARLPRRAACACRWSSVRSAIVAGGVLLAAERDRPGHLRARGLLFAAGAATLFATRDNLVRALHAHAEPADRGCGDAPRGTRRGGAVDAARADAARAEAARAGRRAVRAVVRLPLRGLLARPRHGRLAARRHRVALGRRARGAPRPRRPRGWGGGSRSARCSSSWAGPLSAQLASGAITA